MDIKTESTRSYNMEITLSDKQLKVLAEMCGDKNFYDLYKKNTNETVKHISCGYDYLGMALDINDILSIGFLVVANHLNDSGTKLKNEDVSFHPLRHTISQINKIEYKKVDCSIIQKTK